MRKNDPLFQEKLDEATNWLMKEFVHWNAIQGELLAKGYENNFYNEEEAAREQRLFRAIAERFLLEDADWGAWQWLETLWAGGDGNTGFNAYVVEFAPSAPSESAPRVLSFYVTRNERFWFATPLAELPGIGGAARTFEVNAVHDAIDAMLRLASPADESLERQDEG